MHKYIRTCINKRTSMQSINKRHRRAPLLWLSSSPRALGLRASSIDLCSPQLSTTSHHHGYASFHRGKNNLPRDEYKI